MPMPHMHCRQGDEIYCPRCSTRWPANEDAPTTPCVEDKRVSQPFAKPKGSEVDIAYRVLAPYFLTYDPSRRRAAEAVVRALNKEREAGDERDLQG